MLKIVAYLNLLLGTKRLLRTNTVNDKSNIVKAISFLEDVEIMWTLVDLKFM